MMFPNRDNIVQVLETYHRW